MRRYTDSEGRAISSFWIIGSLGFAFTAGSVSRIIVWFTTGEPMREKYTGKVVPFVEDADLTLKFLGVGIVLLVLAWAFRVGVVNPIVRRRKSERDATIPR